MIKKQSVRKPKISLKTEAREEQKGKKDTYRTSKPTSGTSRPMSETSRPMFGSSIQMSMKSTPMANRKLVYAIVIVIALAAIAYNFRSLAFAAFVNGKPISRYQLVKELEKQGGEQVLESIMIRTLIDQEAQKKNITISQKVIDDEMKELEKQFETQGQTLDSVLESQGLTRKDIEEDKRLTLILEKLLKDKVKVTDKDVQEAFDEQKDSLEEGADEDKVKEDLKASLESQKMQEATQAFIEDLKEKASIQYFVKY